MIKLILLTLLFVSLIIGAFAYSPYTGFAMAATMLLFGIKSRIMV